jgi:hypothetical protein
MQSYKAANPYSQLSDFVHWHSPRDWIGPGKLSERFDGDSLWLELWENARRVPASHQKPLFHVDKEASSNNDHWIGIVLKLGKNVADYDDANTRLSGFNMLIRANDRMQIYTLLDGVATQDSSTSFTNYKYFKFNVSPKVGDNNSFVLTVSGSITKDGSFTLINSIEALYSDYDNFTDEQPMYLCFANRDSWSGSVKFYV